MKRCYQIQHELVTLVKEKGEASIADYLLGTDQVDDGALSHALLNLRVESNNYEVESSDQADSDIVVRRRVKREEQPWDEQVLVNIYDGEVWRLREVTKKQVTSWEEFEPCLVGMPTGYDFVGHGVNEDGDGCAVRTYRAGTELSDFEFVVHFEVGCDNEWVAVTTFPALLAFAREAQPFIDAMVRAYENHKWKHNLQRAEYAKKAEPFTDAEWEKEVAHRRGFFTKELRRIRTLNEKRKQLEDNPFV